MEDKMLIEINNMAKEALDRANSAHDRINNLDKEVKDIHTLTAAMGRVDEKVDNVIKDVSEMKTDLKNIASIPTKRYEKFISGIIGAISTGIIGTIFAFILK